MSEIPCFKRYSCWNNSSLCGAETRKRSTTRRSAGTYVQFVAKEGQYATLRLKSGEVRKVLTECRATIGEVSNQEHSLKSFGKAGAKRWIGVRPTVRGVAMNPLTILMEVVREKHLEEDILFLHGEFLLKDTEPEAIKEQIH